MPVEGMVRVETLGRDYYIFDEERQELRGEHSGETFRLGQRVTVKLAGVHVGRLEIDLEYQKDDEGRRPFRRKSDDHAPRRARFEDKDGHEHRGRRAFADRKGFRPRRDDEELKRQRRYASDSWDEEGPREESFRDRAPRPWNKDRRGDEGGRDGDFRSGRRPFGKKPSFRHEERFPQDEESSFRKERRPFRGREDRPFHEDDRPSFRRDDGERRPFRTGGRRFREDDETRGERRFFRSGRGDGDSRFDRENNRHDRPGRPFPKRHERRDFEADDERSFRREERPFRTRDDDRREHRFAGRHEDRHAPRDHAFRPGKPHRDHRENDGFHGAPDDFFAIKTEPEKPVHRFGKRRK